MYQQNYNIQFYQTLNQETLANRLWGEKSSFLSNDVLLHYLESIPLLKEYFYYYFSNSFHHGQSYTLNNFILQLISDGIVSYGEYYEYYTRYDATNLQFSLKIATSNSISQNKMWKTIYNYMLLRNSFPNVKIPITTSMPLYIQGLPSPVIVTPYGQSSDNIIIEDLFRIEHLNSFFYFDRKINNDAFKIIDNILVLDDIFHLTPKYISDRRYSRAYSWDHCNFIINQNLPITNYSAKFFVKDQKFICKYISNSGNEVTIPTKEEIYSKINYNTFLENYKNYINMEDFQ